MGECGAVALRMQGEVPDIQSDAGRPGGDGGENMNNKNQLNLPLENAEKKPPVPLDVSCVSDKLPVVSDNIRKSPIKKYPEKNPRKDCTDLQERELLDETGGLCPLCGEPLIGYKNGRRFKLYDIAHIYPHSPTPKQLEDLKDIPVPKDVESLDNLILLCKKSHPRQDFYTTRDDYLLLYAKKQQLVAEYRARQEAAGVDLATELKDILMRLLALDDSELTELSFEPILVRRKIKEASLRRKVLNYVSLYYETLKLQFRELDNRRSTMSRVIASQFKLAFVKQRASSLLLDREQIFNGLVEWVQSKVGGSRSACEAVVSYFIQDCEVFDEISEQSDPI